jgi:ATP-binding cassette subfamily B protein
VVDRPHARPLKRARGQLTVSRVDFGYRPDALVLSDVSFEIPAGARVGISGATGSGKTTLVSLLTRFFDPVAGELKLDGVDLRDYRLADLRGQFSVVLQEPVLFATTVWENIAYARPGADRLEIEEAARLAHADEFIRALPEGYDTRLGERGLDLSGGERQRLSLARAFLRDAPILILDEPTSALDPRTEELVLEATERLMAGRTTVIIAHRSTLFERCDLRLALEHGHVERWRPGDDAPVPMRSMGPGAAATGS